MSTAISFAALFKKPILFIITNEHYKNISLIQYTKNVSRYFKSDLINIEKKKNFKIIATGGYSHLFKSSLDYKVSIDKDITIKGLIKIINKKNL